jgi:hypothetical protein
MSVSIYVDAYSGYKANERPISFQLDGHLYQIDVVEDQWYSPDAMFFRVRTCKGKKYLLRFNERAGVWTLSNAGSTATN